MRKYLFFLLFFTACADVKIKLPKPDKQIVYVVDTSNDYNDAGVDASNQ